MTDLTTSSSIISATTYGAANQMLTMSGNVNETRTYNAMLQLTGLSNGSVSITYAYSSTQNNGKIISQTDGISGEQVQYTYDSLNRLATAAATSGSWGQSYAYDGFGNLTDQNVTAGSAPAYHVSPDPTTNRLGPTDANGNSTASINGSSPVYDVENRLATIGYQGVQYSYAPGNKRVWRGVWTSSSLTTDEITYWSVTGQKLATYQLSTGTNNYTCTGPPSYPCFTTTIVTTQSGTNYYFGGKLIKNAGGYVGADRLGSIGHYYPYGQEKPSATTNGTEKFTAYMRDAETGLDYADQRYHDPGKGRFLNPDPYMASGGPADPASWNRYSYVEGDPINYLDPSGQYIRTPGNAYDPYGDDPQAGLAGGSANCSDQRIPMPGCVNSSSVGAGGPPAPPCGPNNPGAVNLTSGQKKLLGETSFSSLTTAQQIVFLTITADAASLHLDLSGYTLNLSQTTIASGAFTQTELGFTASNSAAVTNLNNSLGLGSNFLRAKPELPGFHSKTYGAGNFRQNVGTNSMQITEAGNGNIQIDIDPNNPDFSLASFGGHAMNVLHNFFTGDTNYSIVASQLKAQLGITVFDCP